MKSLTSVWRMAPTAGVYAASVIAMLLGEATLSKSAGPEVYGSFRLLLNAAPVLVSVGFMGYTAAVTRNVAEGDGHAIGFTPHVLVRLGTTGSIALLGSLGLVALADVSLRTAISLVPLAVGIALLTHISGVQRALGKPGVAALSQQGYRLLGGITLVAVSPIALSVPPPEWLMAMCAIGLGAAMSIWLVRYPQQRPPGLDEHKAMVRLGHGFFLSAVSVSLTEFMDQFLIVASEGGTALAGVYSALKLFLVAPIVAVAAILSFVALPVAVKYVKKRSATEIRRSLIIWLAASVAMGVTLGSIGATAYRWFYGESADAVVVLILASVGVLRLFYVWASALLGATTQKYEMHFLGLAGLAGVGLMPLLFWLLNDDPIFAAAVAVGASYLIRNAVALFLAISSIGRVRSP